MGKRKTIRKSLIGSKLIKVFKPFLFFQKGNDYVVFRTTDWRKVSFCKSKGKISKKNLIIYFGRAIDKIEENDRVIENYIKDFEKRNKWEKEKNESVK